MKKNFYPLIALLVLTAAALACTIPLGGGGQPSSSDQVATVVAATFQALTPVTSGGETLMPASEGVLPHALYYINNDKTGIPQVFRLAPDGKTVAQLTFEPSAVSSYDVSMTDGSIVFVANNQILLVNADGSGRRMLVDGGPVDPNNPFTTSISSPVFSPDGQSIAYSSNKGLTLYAVSTGASNIVLERKSDSGSPVEMYIPQKYSPNGMKLLLTTAIPNSDGISSGIYNITTNTLTRLTGGDGVRLCCTQQAWTSDSSALYVGISSVGIFGSGLWRVDASSGNLTTLLPTEAGGGAYNLASFPYLAPDGNLYFFYNTALNPDGFIDRPPLQIVRSAVDGVNGRTVLRPETFETLNEALWAPDASFVIVAKAPDSSAYQGGTLELFSTDGTKSMIPLLSFGWQLKWGP